MMKRFLVVVVSILPALVYCFAAQAFTVADGLNTLFSGQSRQGKAPLCGVYAEEYQKIYALRAQNEQRRCNADDLLIQYRARNGFVVLTKDHSRRQNIMAKKACAKGPNRDLYEEYKWWEARCKSYRR